MAVELGAKVRTYLSGEDYRISSDLLGTVVRAGAAEVWVEHKLESRWPGRPVELIWWACMSYPPVDVEPYSATD